MAYYLSHRFTNRIMIGINLKSYLSSTLWHRFYWDIKMHTRKNIVVNPCTICILEKAKFQWKILYNYFMPFCATVKTISQGARFLKIDLAQLSSKKRFDFRNSYYYPSTTFLGTSYSQIVVAVFQEEPFCTPIPFLLLKTKWRHLNKKWYPGCIQMMHTVVISCQNLDKDLNNYGSEWFASRSTTFML